MTTYTYPKELKKLRACINCKLLKTEPQWLKDKVCENCGEIRDDYLTSHFKGMIAYTDPNNSWAAKWLVKPDVIPGIYCVSVDSAEQEQEDYEADEVADDADGEEQY